MYNYSCNTQRTSDPHGPNSFRGFGDPSSFMIGESLHKKKRGRAHGLLSQSMVAGLCLCLPGVPMRLAEPRRGMDSRE
jgi:hypothetical protein